MRVLWIGVLLVCTNGCALINALSSAPEEGDAAQSLADEGPRQDSDVSADANEDAGVVGDGALEDARIGSDGGGADVEELLDARTSTSYRWEPSTVLDEESNAHVALQLSLSGDQRAVVAREANVSTGNIIAVAVHEVTRGWNDATIDTADGTREVLMPVAAALADESLVVWARTACSGPRCGLQYSTKPLGQAWSTPVTLVADYPVPVSDPRWDMAVSPLGSRAIFAWPPAGASAGGVRRYVNGQGWAAPETLRVGTGARAIIDEDDSAIVVSISTSAPQLLTSVYRTASGWSSSLIDSPAPIGTPAGPTAPGRSALVLAGSTHSYAAALWSTWDGSNRQLWCSRYSASGNDWSTPELVDTSAHPTFYLYQADVDDQGRVIVTYQGLFSGRLALLRPGQATVRAAVGDVSAAAFAPAGDRLAVAVHPSLRSPATTIVARELDGEGAWLTETTTITDSGDPSGSSAWVAGLRFDHFGQGLVVWDQQVTTEVLQVSWYR